MKDCPFFAFSGADDSTATSPRLGSLRPAAVIPELPRKARLPIVDCSTRIHPEPSSYEPTIVSSARNAPSPTVVSEGMSSTVDASTSLPIFAPSSRSHGGVSIDAYSGYSQVRAASMSRSVAHACHATRECTGWKPSCIRIARRRTPTSVISANRANAHMTAGTDHAAASAMAAPKDSASPVAESTIAIPAAIATSGIPARTRELALYIADQAREWPAYSRGHTR